MEDKKPLVASEILLEIRQKIDNIEKYCHNIELTNRLILQKLGEAKPNLLSVAPTAAPTIEPPVVPGLKAPSKPPPVLKDGKVQVQQKLLYPDGRLVLLAYVEIFDEKGNSIKKTRTNSAGKWNASLAPGKYSVLAKKGAVEAGKPAVELKQDVVITAAEKLLELEPVTI